MKKFVKGFKEGMRVFGNRINILIISILLFIVYVVGVGITSVVAKIMGKKFLETTLDQDTYWQDLSLTKKPEAEYMRQF